MENISTNYIIAIVSGVFSELNTSTSEYDYCIGTLKDSNIFDKIVIASPDDTSSEKIESLANNWQVNYYAGARDNVLERFNGVVEKFVPKIIVRVQLRACWVDIKLIEEAIELIKSGYDYIDHGLDINYAMGADVFTRECFLKSRIEINTMENGIEKNTYIFSPWAYMQKRDKFNVGTIEKVELYSIDRVEKLRSKMENLIGKEENMLSVTPQSPGMRYQMVSKYLNEGDVVLDIACGRGGGSKYLSKYCSIIHGVDYDARYIEYANTKYSNMSTVIFHQGTDKSIGDLGTIFNKIVSLHTLEHVEDDYTFLMNLNTYLKPDGELILEVPRLLKYPLNAPLWPFHSREYTTDEIRSLLNRTGFKVLEEKGGNRNQYVEISEAREVLFFVAVKEGI